MTKQIDLFQAATGNDTNSYTALFISRILWYLPRFRSLPTLFLIMLSQPSIADPGIALGINLTYDFRIGFTVKLISSHKVDETVIAAGTSFYPFAEKEIGFDLGFGRTAGLNTFWLYGVDIYQDASYMSAGFFNSKFNKNNL